MNHCRLPSVPVVRDVVETDRRIAVLTIIHLVVLLLLASPASRADEAGALPAPEQHEFVIRNFRTESGAVLPEARVVYGTYGRLNAAGDNAILLPSHFMADLHGYEWLIGPAAALDPNRWFLITSELFGNGRSSSPSNTPEPFHRPRFPVMTIRDNVNAVHALLTEELHVSHLKAVIGFSMGAQQAFQWGVSYPGYLDAIVATAGTAKTYPHGIIRLEGQIAALTADPVFNGGDYTVEPKVGIQAFSMVWAGWLYSQPWWRLGLWKETVPAGATFEDAKAQARTWFDANDANDLLLQCRTWQSNDVGATAPFNGDERAALRSIRARVLYMPAATDLYFPLTDAEYEAPFLTAGKLVPIPSLWGHPAGAGEASADRAFINAEVRAFLLGVPDAAATGGGSPRAQHGHRRPATAAP